MAEKEQQQSWSEQLPHYVEAARAASKGLPVLFIDASKFDQDAISSITDEKKQHDEITRQVAEQLERQQKGSSSLLHPSTILNMGMKARSGLASAISDTTEDLKMVFIAVPSPEQIQKSYDDSLSAFYPEHIKDLALTLDRYIESVAVHEATHAFHKGEDADTFATDLEQRQKIANVLQGEIPADLAAYHYLKEKYGNHAAQDFLDIRTLRATSEKTHATSFFITSGTDPNTIDPQQIEALQSLLGASIDAAQQGLKISENQAFKLRRDDPQQFAKAMQDAIKEGLPKTVNLEIDNWSLRGSLAEKLNIYQRDMSIFIDEHPDKVQKAYDELKAEGVTTIPSVYTNPYVIQYMEEYIKATQRVFKEETPPRYPDEPELEEEEVDQSTSSFRNNASDMLADKTAKEDKKPAIQIASTQQLNLAVPALEA